MVLHRVPRPDPRPHQHLPGKDPFPEGRDPKKIDDETGEIRHGEVDVCWGFFLHLYNNFTSEVHWALFYKLYPALHWLVKQFMLFFALNMAFKKQTTISNETFRAWIYGSAACFFTSLALWSLAQQGMVELRLGGKSRKLLREQITGTTARLASH